MESDFEHIFWQNREIIFSGISRSGFYCHTPMKTPLSKTMQVVDRKDNAVLQFTATDRQPTLEWHKNNDWPKKQYIMYIMCPLRAVEVCDYLLHNYCNELQRSKHGPERNPRTGRRTDTASEVATLRRDWNVYVIIIVPALKMHTRNFISKIALLSPLWKQGR